MLDVPLHHAVDDLEGRGLLLGIGVERSLDGGGHRRLARRAPGSRNPSAVSLRPMLIVSVAQEGQSIFGTGSRYLPSFAASCPLANTYLIATSFTEVSSTTSA